MAIISSYHPTMKIHTQSLPTFRRTQSLGDFMDQLNCEISHSSVVTHLLTFFSCSSRQNHSFWWIPIGCCKRCRGDSMIGSLPASYVITLQIQPICGFWCRKEGRNWWDRPPQTKMGKYGQKKLITNTYPASRANTNGSNNGKRWC